MTDKDHKPPVTVAETEAEKTARLAVEAKKQAELTKAVGSGLDATLERAKDTHAAKRKVIWKPSTAVFLGLDEAEVAEALGLPIEKVAFTYTHKPKDGVPGVELTGARK